MKIRSLAMFSALVLFASSCEENVNKGTVWDDPHFIRVTSSLEPIKERGEDKGFPWALEDTISLYDQEYREVPIRNIEEGSNERFSGLWHQGHRRLQPLKNTVVRIPFPSPTEKC